MFAEKYARDAQDVLSWRKQPGCRTTEARQFKVNSGPIITRKIVAGTALFRGLAPAVQREVMITARVRRIVTAALPML
jgi:hypothetical protein